jgi:hypothetical protein
LELRYLMKENCGAAKSIDRICVLTSASYPGG